MKKSASGFKFSVRICWGGGGPFLMYLYFSPLTFRARGSWNAVLKSRCNGIQRLADFTVRKILLIHVLLFSVLTDPGLLSWV